MRVPGKLIVATTFFCAASVANGQQVQLQLSGAPPPQAVTAAGFYIGPFMGTLLSDPTLPTISLFSLDLLNAISWGDQWQASVSGLDQTQISSTRFGTASIDTYRKAAWLSGQLALNSSPAERADIQVAIWSLFTPNISVAGFTGQYWVNAVNSFAATNAWSSYNWSQYSVLTGGPTVGQAEFVTSAPYFTQPTVTPEPATLLLLATGLVGVIGLAMRGVRLA